MKFCESVSIGVMSCAALVPVALAGDNPLEFSTDIRRCVASYAGNGAGSTWQDRPFAYEPYKGGANIEVTNGLETWFSSSVQNSEMDGFSMRFSGDGAGTAVAVPLSSPLTSQGQSKFDLYFSVNEQTEYALHAVIGELGHADSQAVVRLSVVGGPVVDELVSSPNSADEFNLTGTLAPGNYRLYAEATGRGRTGPIVLVSSGTATCTVEFTADSEIFDPADWNGDRLVNTSDFFEFVVDFDGGEADFDRSGNTDSQDWFGFLSAFNR
jgi:hypothetical protein